MTLTDITRLRQAEQTREALLIDLEQANKELATIESLAHAGLQLTTVEQLAHSIASQVAVALEPTRRQSCCSRAIRSSWPR